MSGVGETRPVARNRRFLAARVAALVAYAVAFAWSVEDVGLPTQREAVLLWLVGALAVAALLTPGRRVLRVLVDWLPFGLVLLAYDYSRGAAKQIGMPLRVTPQITMDRWLGFGKVPTVWLQRRLIDPDAVHLWEVVPTLVYLSHFLVPYIVAAWLYARDRERWVGYAGRFVTLSFVGVATYILLPWAPPWYASRLQLLPPLHRSVGRGWTFLHLSTAAALFDKGQATVNLTAALPSLHAAYPMLIAAYFWRRCRWPLRVVLVAYPILMAFTLVLSAEHYVVDILLGWCYAGLVHLGWTRLDHRRQRRRSPGGAAEVDGAGPPSTVAAVEAPPVSV